MKRIIRGIVGLCLLVGLLGAEPAARPINRPVDRFEKVIVGYEARDRENPPPAGATLFVGSSTFGLWKSLEEDMKPIVALNRGFGGSTIPEVIHYMDRIILPYKPARIVLYIGGNDIADGVPAEEVFERFKLLEQKVREALPETSIHFISLKSAPIRARFSAQYDLANQLIREYIDKTPGLFFIDTRPLLLDERGMQREDLYLPDRLHLNRQGYERWIPALKTALNGRDGAGGERRE
jgi:lysophospholipase L1-like esterase